MITGIILAGGLSTRAGQNKLLLEVGGKPIILHTIEAMRPFVDKLIVVTGKYHDELNTILKDVEVVFNKNFKDGMFSSVRAGVAHAEGNFFVLPGDCPFVSKKTMSALLDCDDSFSIRVPAYNGRTGHPVYVNRKLRRHILHEPPDSNLRIFRDEVGYEVIDVDDKNILNDVDTIEDYEKLLKERK